ncbi:hypothetical protein C8P68_10173 [Mucilaginibacter yixingensis]|uniref:Uncharacterized protein n=1 Tax=Mucilaginibacter yixingensis TaxID=1295612 RepID=A0A2T5JEL4_9SPHI|nr:hypothetical protein [Mucilaginibacter yixingensis]PTR00845.1 hypothetical protein C8P68_10173 [Mucilaginibacter yixingensis]
MLVAINKIADYVQENPEAKSELLTWLKNHPYRRHQITSDPERPYDETGISPGIGDFSIRYISNYAAGIELITWVGTPAEYEAMVLLQYPNSVKRVKVIEKVIAPPPVMAYKTKEISRPPVAKETIGRTEQVDLIPDGEPFKTTAAYEQALTKAETLMRSKSGTPEYEELIQLLPSIKAYEKQKLSFPKITPAEIIRERMRIFKIEPHELPLITRFEFKADDFFAGQLELPTDVLAHLYKSLSLWFPVTDYSYM